MGSGSSGTHPIGARMGRAMEGNVPPDTASDGELLDWARSRFSHDTYATEVTGIEVLSVTRDHVRCGLQLTDRHLNAMGSVMGGVCFTLADFTFAIASNLGGTGSVATSCTIQFLTPPKGGVIYSESTCIRSGRKMCFYEVRITDSESREVARFISSGFHTAVQ